MESRFRAVDADGLHDMAESKRRARAIADAILELIGDREEWVGTLSQIKKHLGMEKLYRNRPLEFGDEIGGEVAELLYEAGVVYRYEAFKYFNPKKAQALLVRRDKNQTRLAKSAPSA